MKRVFSTLIVVVLLLNLSMAQEKYTPAPENLEARKWFRDASFGLFIHWGVYSVLGDGEWVMNQQQMSRDDFTYCRILSTCM